MPVVTAPEEMDLILERVRRRPCILCGRAPAGSAGMWRPGNPADELLVGKALRGVRLVAYPACNDCLDGEGACVRIEERIRAELLLAR